MIQDIAPHKFHLDYSTVLPDDEDTILVFNKAKQVLVHEGEIISLPVKSGLPDIPASDCIFLFSIDETRFFAFSREYDEEIPEGFKFVPIMELRYLEPRYLSYAAATGQHLYLWYQSNTFCGRCGKPMVRDEKERAVRCPFCGNLVFPRISPSTIIGVIDRKTDRILVTQYNPRHVSSPTNVADRTKTVRVQSKKSYALVAGYIEIGESGEMTVAREVMEEVGLKVKNIRYYASQPWAFSQAFLLGYICDLDGEDTVKLQEDELTEAVWLKRDELPDRSSDYSLTSAIMEAFRKGEI